MSSSPAVTKNAIFRLRSFAPRSWGSPPSPSVHPPANSILDSIRYLANEARLSDAFLAYATFRFHFCSPGLAAVQPISSLLWCSASLVASPQGRQLHAHVIALGLQDNPSLVSRLVSFYAGCCALADARAIAEGSGTRDCLPWNILISAYVKVGFFENALTMFDTMVDRGVMVDHFTYPTVLKACGEMTDLELGRKVHEQINKGGLEWNLYVHNALVSMYAKCGDLDTARKLFEGMLERDAVSWNSMISAYASKGMWDQAFDLFEQMRAVSKELNVVTLNIIAGGKLQMGDHLEALRLISQLRKSGSSLDFVTVITALNACTQMGCLRSGKEVHGFAQRNLFDEPETVRNSLITMYSRCQQTNYAEILFRTATTRSLVTWNCMISGFALLDQLEKTSLLFQDMVWSGIRPNHVTIVAVLSLCGHVANLRHGKELHCYILKHGFEDHRLLWNSLIDMYCKSGRIMDGQKIFNLMKDRDEVSYTSLIDGYGTQGEGFTSLRLFDEMIHCGIKPDNVAMVAVLSACSHAGLLAEGEMLFDKMTTLYGLDPKLEHYSCMVDLYGRAGFLSKAEEVLNTMPIRPTALMWAALLGACQVRRNTKIGEKAADRLLKMKTDNPGHYVLIANMYASAGCWVELAKVRILMRDLGLRKTPGYAWVDLGNGSHPFMVEDRDCSYAGEIYCWLGRLSDHMRDAGYVCDENLGFDE